MHCLYQILVKSCYKHRHKHLSKIVRTSFMCAKKNLQYISSSLFFLNFYFDHWVCNFSLFKMKQAYTMAIKVKDI